jgi:PAS domain S-box-containing protein
LLDDAVVRRLVDSVSDYAILLLTTDGRIATWNAGAQRQEGWTADEAIGRPFTLSYPTDMQPAHGPEEALRQAAEVGRFEEEGWRLRKDGSRYWANTVIGAVRDESGRLLGYSLVTRDSTERREQEKRLRESERNLRLLIEGVQDYAIFRLDPTGVITTWNLGAERIKGYAADEIIGRHFSAFYPPEAIASGWPQEELRRASAAGRFEDEGWRVRKDGSLFWASVTITAIRDEQGELLGFSKVTRDLTRRREQEMLLRESEENLRLLIDAVRDHAIFLLAPDGTVRTWNAGAQRLMGYGVGEIVGQPAGRLYTDADRAAGRPQAHLMSAAASGLLEEDAWRQRADGTRVWVHSTLTALRDDSDGPRGYVQILRDLSDRLRVEELESEGQRIHEFIAMLSHELRNPLAPISNAVRLLQRRHADADVLRCADLISRQANHLARLVDDLLDVSRITRGKVRLQPVTVDLNHLVRQATEAMRPGAEAMGLTLDLALSDASPYVDGDPTRLTQVVNNLVSNAVKYTPSGGRIAVDVRTAPDDDVAIIQVADNGIGMSEALMERAFEPFVQGSRGLDRPGGGLGIGLTLVRSVVELHRGQVSVASAGADRGSTFTVALPLSRAVVTPPVPVPDGAAAAPGRRRVLIVDDNHDAAESLGELLELHGHEVRLANDGEAALHEAQDAQPDLVLLDLGLPGLDGFEVARRLRAIPGLEHTQLVALTGYGQQSDREATAAAGFDAHLVKPVDFEELSRIVSKPASSRA